MVAIGFANVILAVPVVGSSRAVATIIADSMPSTFRSASAVLVLAAEEAKLPEQLLVRSWSCGVTVIEDNLAGVESIIATGISFSEVAWLVLLARRNLQ
ncbi:hypothetical protein XPA_005383 [Xanthoria parietina]